MTYKQIEASRELRLWIGQIIVPATSIAVTVLAIPEIRQKVVEQVQNVKGKFRRIK